MTEKQSKNSLLPAQSIDYSIYVIRGQRVMLDEDLAALYQVGTKVLNQTIRRNKERFPADFMFQLNVKEFANLRSQIVTSSYGGRRYMPFVFTEHGTVMLASVLRSRRAIQMSIEVVKAFVRLRKILVSQNEMAEKINEVRSFILRQSSESSQEFRKIWKAIDDLRILGDDSSKNPIGFRLDV